MEKVNLNKVDIEALIPHAGGMCLIEQVIGYSIEDIVCQTRSHLLDDNPLKEKGVLSKMHLIEYGAQAVAIHGGLIERTLNQTQLESPNVGYIAMVKSVVWQDFNPLTAQLTIRATVIMADNITKRYGFCIVDAEQQEICSGNILVVHPAD